MVINEPGCTLEMSTLNSDSTATNARHSYVEGQGTHPPLHRISSTRPELRVEGQQPTEVVRAVIVRFDDAYLKTFPGVIRMIQVMCSLICLVFVTSSGGRDVDYLQLPVSSRLRTLVFCSVTGFLLSIFMIALRVTLTIHMFPISWNMFDIILHSFLSLLFLVTSSLVANVCCQMGDKTSQWTTQQLVGAIVFGYICTIAYAATAALAVRQRIRKDRQCTQKFQLSQQSSNSTFVEHMEA